MLSIGLAKVYSHVYKENSYSERSRSSGALNSDRKEPASKDLLSRPNVARCSWEDSQKLKFTLTCLRRIRTLRGLAVPVLSTTITESPLARIYSHVQTSSLDALERTRESLLSRVKPPLVPLLFIYFCTFISSMDGVPLHNTLWQPNVFGFLDI